MNVGALKKTLLKLLIRYFAASSEENSCALFLAEIESVSYLYKYIKVIVKIHI